MARDFSISAEALSASLYRIRRALLDCMQRTLSKKASTH
jgi:hypothetical protein